MNIGRKGFRVQWHLAVGAFAVLHIFSAHSRNVSAQRPPYQVIFDDFEYAGTTQLFGSNSWRTRNGGSITSRMWYRFNWEDCAIDSKARITMGSGIVRLAASPGHRRIYSCPGGSLPPQIQGGFTARHGVWAARLQLEDIERASNLTQAFWVISPHSAYSSRSGRKSKHWSEFNHEWNNFFGEARPLGLKMYLASGASIDGESSSEIIRGGLGMRNPRHSGDADYTCSKTLHGRPSTRQSPTECRDWFLKDLRGRAGQWVDLMIAYDGNWLVISMVALTENVGIVQMERKVQIGRRVQPLMPIIGMLVDGVLDRPHGMSVDWFYYSPNTDLTLVDVRADIKRFREMGWKRVNLDSVSIASPPLSSLRVDLESPADATGHRKDFVAYPSQRETEYFVEWNYRSFNRSRWRMWSGWRRGGFTLALPERGTTEVQVRVRDRYSDDGWAYSDCVSYDFARSRARRCTGDNS